MGEGSYAPAFVIMSVTDGLLSEGVYLPEPKDGSDRMRMRLPRNDITAVSSKV